MRTWRLVSLATLRATASYLAAAALLTGAVHLSTLDALASATPDTPAPTPTPPLCESAPGGVYIDAGTVTNTTTLDLSADGGTGIGDSSGGDDNLATTGGDDDKDHDKKGNNKNNKKDNRDRDDDDDGEISAAGNGGLSDAGADGGAITMENVNSGGNVGSAIAVGDTVGGSGYGCDAGSRSAAAAVHIVGGTVTNETIIEVSADGGTAIADASGGDGNVAANGGSAGNGGVITTSAGNGGVSTASADGGAISIGDVNSGGNAGNAISVGDTVAGPVPVPVPVCCPAPPKPVPGKPSAPIYTPPGKVVVVTRLPSTGAGTPLAGSASLAALLALATGAASLASRRRPPMI